MKTALLPLLFFVFSFQLLAQSPVKNHAVEGMRFHWQFDGDRLFMTLVAPTKGWVSIGFNDQAKTEGTNIYKAKVIKRSLQIDQFLILNDGSLKSLPNRKGQKQILDEQAMEGNRGTTVMFSIPSSASDKDHINLKANQEYFVTLTYAKHDDFGSESIFTRTIPLKL